MEKQIGLKVARELVRIAKELSAAGAELPEGKTLRVDGPSGKELVLVPSFDEAQSGRLVESSDDSTFSDIGNKTDRRLPYEVWAIDLKGIDPGSQEFDKLERLIRSIEGDIYKKWILWSSNVNIPKLEEVCKENNLRPDAVNDNIDEVIDYYKANSRKVYVQHYIDRRNVCLNNLSKAIRTRTDGKKTVYAIDFDGTIAVTDDTFPYVEKANDEVVKFIKEVIQPDPNRQWVLYTCRVDEPERIAEQWCHDNGLFPDAVNSNVRNHGSRKVDADYYIDDRNVDPLSGLE